MNGLIPKDQSRLISKRLKRARKKIDFSLEDVAACLKIPPSELSNIESGESDLTFHRVEQLAHIYHEDFQDFLGDEIFILDGTAFFCGDSRKRISKELKLDIKKVEYLDQILENRDESELPIGIKFIKEKQI